MNDENTTAPITGTPDAAPAADTGAGTTTATLPPPAAPQPPPARPRFADRVWGWRSTLAVAIASLIIGGLAGFAIGHASAGGDDRGFGPGRGGFGHQGHGLGPGGQNGQQMQPPNGQGGPQQ